MLPRTSFELFKKERFYLEKFDALCLHAGGADYSGPETDAGHHLQVLSSASWEPTIPVRKQMLTRKQEKLRQSIRELEESVAYIDWKQNFYDEVLSGQRPYESNLIRK